FAVIGGSALAAGTLTGRGPGPSTVGVPAAAPGGLPPVADVWPDAVHKVSGKLADGRGYRIETMVDDHRLLIATEASFENANELWLLDLTTSKARRVVKLPEPHAGRQTFASHFTVGSGQIVWWDTYTEDKKGYTRIWKAPLTGGEPTLVSTVTGAYGTYGSTGDRLLVHGDHIYLSAAHAGGIRKLPLGGGEPELMADTEGYHLLAWPWIAKSTGDPGGPDCALEPDGAPKCDWEGNDTETCTTDPMTQLPVCNRGDAEPTQPADEEEFRPLVFVDMRSLEDGEERPAKLPDRDFVSVFCAVTYCVGDTEDGKSYSWQRDGSDEKLLPGAVAMMMDPPGGDRFVFLTKDEGGSPWLYDLKTGKSASLGIKAAPDGGMSVPAFATADSRAFHWSLDNTRSYLVFDMAAVK
ncbi:MAG: TolB family protein, partial [Micromonosporaceae bacterium]